MKIYKPGATLLPAIAQGRDKPSDLARLEVFASYSGVDIKRPPLFEEKVFGASTLPLGDRCCSKG